jgi:hypothetical protein
MSSDCGTLSTGFTALPKLNADTGAGDRAHFYSLVEVSATGKNALNLMEFGNPAL